MVFLMLLAFQLILDLKLVGVADAILSILLAVFVPVMGLLGLWLEQRVYISIRPRRERRRREKVPLYTFVETKSEFKQSWPMVEVDSGKEIRIE